MKVQPSVKKRCKNCQLVRRKGGVLYNICITKDGKKTKKHYQRQG